MGINEGARNAWMIKFPGGSIHRGDTEEEEEGTITPSTRVDSRNSVPASLYQMMMMVLAGWLIYSRHDLRELFNSNSPDPLMTNILMVDQEEGGKGRGGARGR